MHPIEIVEAIATLFWTYAGLAALDWVRHVARTERSVHVALAAGLVGNLVPAMITLVIVVLAGIFLGLPSVVVIIAVLFPAGLAFGLHQALNDVREATWGSELTRIALAALIGAAIIWVRQLS